MDIVEREFVDIPVCGNIGLEPSVILNMKYRRFYGVLRASGRIEVKCDIEYLSSSKREMRSLIYSETSRSGVWY